MSKESASKAKRPSANLAPVEHDTAEDAGEDLAQTAAFGATQEEDAADFLLGEEEVEESEEPEATKPAIGGPRAEAAHEPELAKTRRVDVSHEPAPSQLAQKRSGERTTVLGDYRLMKKLGQGGMGTVYKAIQTKLDKEVALKVLSRELAGKPAFVQRFQREARVMAKLDHVNILRCFDVGAAGNYHYLVMEYADGGSVESWLKKLGRFSVGDALRIVLTTAAALQYAHEQNLIHRDIKADNLLLTKNGVIKIADLGLAKALDEDLGLTKTGTGAGTPYYMAPEQARDAKRVDRRVDIYALGVLVYVLVTGAVPFQGGTLVEVVEAKEKGKFTRMRKFNAEVPEKLDLIVDKMLAAKPEHRYASCAEVILDLDGLGLANDRLSFIEPARPAPARGMPAAKPVNPAGLTSRPRDDARGEKGADWWYWTAVDDFGNKTIKKLTGEEIAMHIRGGTMDADAQLSRTREGGYRAAGTYGEFQAELKKNTVSDKADRKGQKFREMYKQIMKEEKSRKRWRWFHNLYVKLGGGLGFLVWMAIVVLLVAGAIFGVKWVIETVGGDVASRAGREVPELTK